jgi:hypothetical protein
MVGVTEKHQVSVTEAKAELTELVRRAEVGDEIVLTRHGYFVGCPGRACPTSR